MIGGTHPLVDTTQLVFDTHIWRGKDKGDNGHCWKEARILVVHDTPLFWDATADVEFLHNERVSRAHYITCMNHLTGCPGYPGAAAHTDPPPRRDQPAAPS